MNTKIVNHSKKDDAVSPVVGVMLMLVVTIVIAAVVALFATSVVTDMDAAPVAVIQMDAYAGEPDVNQNLCMSIIGGKALELSKLKCVVTIDDGKYGLVFKSLDTDPLVGKFLEIGEKLEVFNFDSATGGMRKVNSLVGADIKTEGALDDMIDLVQSYWEVGNKVNVMIVFNEDAILYKRDIIIQDGIHKTAGSSITIDTSSSTADWTKDGKPLTTLDLDWTESKITVSNLKNGDNSVDVIIEDNSSASNGSSAIVLNAAPKTPNKAIEKVTVNSTDVLPCGSTTITGNFSLKATQGDIPTQYTVDLRDVAGATWAIKNNSKSVSAVSSIQVIENSTIGLYQTNASNVYELKINNATVEATLTITDSTKQLAFAEFQPIVRPGPKMGSVNPITPIDILGKSTKVTNDGRISCMVAGPDVTFNKKNGGTGEEVLTWTYNGNPVTGSVIAPVGATITFGVNTDDNVIWIDFNEPNSGLTMEAVGSIESGTITGIDTVTLDKKTLETGKSTVGTGGEIIVSFN